MRSKAIGTNYMMYEDEYYEVEVSYDEEDEVPMFYIAVPIRIEEEVRYFTKHIWLYRDSINFLKEMLQFLEERHAKLESRGANNDGERCTGEA